jgi:hypothetical protein
VPDGCILRDVCSTSSFLRFDNFLFLPFKSQGCFFANKSPGGWATLLCDYTILSKRAIKYFPSLCDCKFTDIAADPVLATEVAIKTNSRADGADWCYRSWGLLGASCEVQDGSGSVLIVRNGIVFP